MFEVNDVYELDGFTWKVSKVMGDGSVRSIKQVNGKGCKGKPRKHTVEQLQNAVKVTVSAVTAETTQE